MQCDIGNTCNDDDKGGVLRIQSGTSTALLIDLIFEANIAYGSTGNIFSTSSSAKLYLMNMPIPTEMVGITPIYKCNIPPTTTDFRSEDYTIGLSTFIKGDAFNVVNDAACPLTSTTTINGGEMLCRKFFLILVHLTKKRQYTTPDDDKKHI